ncbi:MAG: Rieske 2Fe-2S domain-containing protein [Chloroflexi bacterium]|nr:Rieske 2Fe-2S domain-containing protein [Chloroflexota bacterium]
MLTAEQNELLCRIGPGTPMGEVVRRYWVPALLSWELTPDGAPVPFRLLGEDLVAFKDTSGRIGVLQSFCAHRATPLWLGRNEENGLRCLYHGWKYDVEGNCIDQMNEPEDLRFKEKIQIRSYPNVEVGEVVWVYFGPADRQPPPPNFEWTQVPASHRDISKVVQDCNWVQAVEGGIDPSHAPVLHGAISMDAGPEAGLHPTYASMRAKPGIYEINKTDYGHEFWAVRPLPAEGKELVLSHHYVAPWTQIRSVQKPFRSPGHMYVPIDDEHCMVWNWEYSFGEEPLSDSERESFDIGMANGPSAVDQKTFRSRIGAEQEWGLDREYQRTTSYSGIKGVNLQDRAVQEAVGTIVDRTVERLGPADQPIIQLRQVLFDAVKTVADGGDPPGTGTSYYGLRGIARILQAGSDYKAETLDEMHPAEFAGSR